MGVGGIVAVLVISAVFYVIGRGEDRDRATPGVPSDAPAEDAPPAPAPARSRRPPAEDPSAAESGPARSRRPAVSARRRRRP